MSVYKYTNQGKIFFSDRLIAREILNVIDRKEYEDVLWLSTSKGKSLMDEDRFLTSESMRNIEIVFDEKSRLKIKYYLIVRFGESIKSTLKVLNQEIAEHLNNKISIMPYQISVVVTGVKSENVSARNMEFKFKYADK